MLGNQFNSYVIAINAASATNGETITSGNIDRLNADAITIAVIGTTSNNATNNPATFKLQESDTTDATNFSDITAFVGDGTGGFTIPNSPTATTTAPFAELNLNLVGRKRYLRLLISPLTTQTYTALALLSRNKESPDSAGEKNVAVTVSG
jgi:hypothetical protein